MRGFRSGHADRPAYAHADDLKALLGSIESAHVFGHSFGGEITDQASLWRIKDELRSLVLIEPDIQGARDLPALTRKRLSFALQSLPRREGGQCSAAGGVDMHPLVTVAKTC